MTFHVNNARLSRAGDEWQVERRDLEVRGVSRSWGMNRSASVEGPRHLVWLEGFLMGQTPVTQAQWRVVARLVVSNQMKVSPAIGDHG
jgi:formylglycine-generating enzyme required for sulfatase activity